MIRSLPRLGSVKRPLITAIGTRIQPGVGFAPTPASRHDSFTTHAARRDKDDSHLPSFLEPTITDDRVSELAAKPLQRFTLADLVRCVAVISLIPVLSVIPSIINSNCRGYRDLRG